MMIAMMGAWVAAAKNAPIPTIAKRTGVNRCRTRYVLGDSAEEKAEARAHEKCWRENSADCAGAERHRRSEHLENEDEGQRLPKPLATQNPIYYAMTVAAHLRIEYRKSTHN